MDSNTGEMTFWEHLEALRGTIIRSVLAVVAVSLVFMFIPSQLFKAVLWPTEPSFIFYNLAGLDFSLSLINIELTAQFFVHLKLSFLCGALVAFPFIVYEIWRFIEPALYEGERKAARRAFGLSSFLFYLGAAVGYLVVLPICLMFFMNYSVSPDVVNQITLGSYISLFIPMVFLLGLLFEFPSAVLLLSNMGILKRSQLRSGRKYAVIITMVLSALITPSDPFSMFALAIPLYGLYEFSIILCKNDLAE